MDITEEDEGEGEEDMVMGMIALDQMVASTLYHQEELKEDVAGILAGGQGEGTDLEGMVLEDAGGIDDADTTVKGS